MRLSAAIHAYLQYKRSYNVDFAWGLRILTLFCMKTGDLPLDGITTRHILDFANAPLKSVLTSRKECSVLNHFFRYWSVREEMPFLLLPHPRPLERPIFVPYVYTRIQIRSLLKAVPSSNKSSLDALTFRTFLLTLYATGAHFSEILNLRFEDLDLKRSRITLSGMTSHRRWRQIPIGPDLRDVLTAFIKSLPGNRPRSSRIFLTKSGHPIPKSTLAERFNLLRRLAGVMRNDGKAIQPRMQDLRPTFAVHRLTSWIKSGSDLNRMLPALATYMGYVGLESADQYLSMTPERFRKDLEKLSPHRGRKRWRDDPDLMKFLSGL